VDFSDKAGGNITQQYTALMIKMLDCCPELEDLHLFPWHPTYLDTTQIFRHGRWPSLKRFSLRSMGDIAPQDDGVLNAFISAHPNIERLYIDTDYYEAPNAKCVWSESLPNLKALHAGLNWDMRQILTPGTTRNLEFLSIVNLSNNSQAKNLNILSQIPTLRSLVVYCRGSSPDLMGRLAQAVPWIERLVVKYWPPRAPLTRSIHDKVSSVSPIK
jgi:hypothetical protein